MPGGYEFTLSPGEGRVVDREGHLHSGGGNFHELNRLDGGRSADGIADGNVADAAHGNDVARGGLGGGHLGKPVKLIDGGGLGLLRRGVGRVEIAHSDLFVLMDGAPLNAANGNAAHKLIVIDGADQHLEGGLCVGLRGRNIVQDGVKEGGQVGTGHVGGVAGGAVAARAEEGGRIELLLGGVQVHQQLQHLVADLVDALVGAVYLVDYHDDPVAQLQGLRKHKAGLGHRTLGRVHQQDNAVDHLQNALHLAAEVGVARRVHDVDLGILVVDGGVFRQDGNAALPLQVARVHDPVHSGLIFPVDAALLEHLVHQGGLAMVNVSNDGNVA